MSPIALRNKTVCLELIASMMTNPGPTFLASKNFRNIVKDSLCGSILVNSISTDKSIFGYSIEIITSLVHSLGEKSY
ncbi:MAG: hypothetical protein EOO43_25090 [Flavobacterium sp.]|nr:MAG: hypothetical protein EOO43_25090 [Flavobacterium sp.]